MEQYTGAGRGERSAVILCIAQQGGAIRGHFAISNIAKMLLWVLTAVVCGGAAALGQRPFVRQQGGNSIDF